MRYFCRVFPKKIAYAVQDILFFSFKKKLLNAGDTIFLNNTRKSTTKLLRLIKEFPTVSSYKNKHVKHYLLLCILGAIISKKISGIIATKLYNTQECS